MVTVVGVLVFVLGLIAWFGQGLAFFSPSVAVKLGVLEPEGEVDASLRIVEAKAEGLMDVLLAWTLPAAALLMTLEHPLWPYLALFGGGVFAYFSGLISLSRLYLGRAGIKVGSPASVCATYLFGGLWMASALIMIGLAAAHLSQ